MDKKRGVFLQKRFSLFADFLFDFFFGRVRGAWIASIRVVCGEGAFQGRESVAGECKEKLKDEMCLLHLAAINGMINLTIHQKRKVVMT